MSAELESLINRTTINFERELDFEEIVDMFRYLRSKLLHGKINYNFSGFGHVGWDSTGSRDYEERYVADVSGNIHAKDYLLCNFSLDRSTTDKFSALKFFTIPGYELSEIPEKELKLMDEARKHIENYFKEKTA